MKLSKALAGSPFGLSNRNHVSKVDVVLPSAKNQVWPSGAGPGAFGPGFSAGAVGAEDLPRRQGHEAIVLDDRVAVRRLAADQALARGEEAYRRVLARPRGQRSRTG